MPSRHRINPPQARRLHTRLTSVRNYLHIILMIICVCRGLNTSKVNAAIEAGARSPAQVHAHHDTKINCGKCCETVCSMIREQSCRGAEMAVASIAAE